MPFSDVENLYPMQNLLQEDIHNIIHRFLPSVTNRLAKLNLAVEIIPPGPGSCQRVTFFLGPPLFDSYGLVLRAKDLGKTKEQIEHPHHGETAIILHTNDARACPIACALFKPIKAFLIPCVKTRMEAVIPTYRRRGIGRLLFDCIEEYAHHAFGLSGMTICCLDEDNDEQLAFVEKLGFCEVDDDAIAMYGAIAGGGDDLAYMREFPYRRKLEKMDAD